MKIQPLSPEAYHSVESVLKFENCKFLVVFRNQKGYFSQGNLEAKIDMFKSPLKIFNLVFGFLAWNSISEISPFSNLVTV